MIYSRPEYGMGIVVAEMEPRSQAILEDCESEEGVCCTVYSSFINSSATAFSNVGTTNFIRLLSYPGMANCSHVTVGVWPSLKDDSAHHCS